MSQRAIYHEGVCIGHVQGESVMRGAHFVYWATPPAGPAKAFPEYDWAVSWLMERHAKERIEA